MKESERVKVICAYRTKEGNWSTAGCHKRQDMSNETFTVCESSHLSSFAVLMALYPMKVGGSGSTQQFHLSSKVRISNSICSSPLPAHLWPLAGHQDRPEYLPAVPLPLHPHLQVLPLHPGDPHHHPPPPMYLSLHGRPLLPGWHLTDQTGGRVIENCVSPLIKKNKNN